MMQTPRRGTHSTLRTACAAAVLLSCFSEVGPAEARELKVAFCDGRVTVFATDSTLGEILDRWTSVGRTVFVSPGPLNDRRLTIQLDGVPEPEALSILLEFASGHVARFRSISVEGESRLDRVVILVDSSASEPAPHLPPIRDEAADSFPAGAAESGPASAGSSRRPVESVGQGWAAPRLHRLTPIERAGQRLKRATLQRLLEAPQPPRSVEATRVPPATPGGQRPGVISPRSATPKHDR